MVFLHCCERGAPSAARPTDDGDLALNVRARPTVLADITAVLVQLGFRSVGISPEGHEHRWTRGDAQLDILVPTGLGNRAGKHTGITGSTTVAAPGAQQAISRSELVQVAAGGVTGRAWRPSLLGALVAKAGAYTTPDPYRDRHIQDFAVLASLIGRADLASGSVTKSDRRHLVAMLKALETKPGLWADVDGADRGVAVLRQRMG